MTRSFALSWSISRFAAAAAAVETAARWGTGAEAGGGALAVVVAGDEVSFSSASVLDRTGLLGWGDRISSSLFGGETMRPFAPRTDPVSLPDWSPEAGRMAAPRGRVLIPPKPGRIPGARDAAPLAVRVGAPTPDCRGAFDAGI